MTQMIQPIATKYKGITFRSRLEARWAVFFYAMGIPFEYEPEGFDIGSEWYLPDFYLPDQRYWVEIKPTLESNVSSMPPAHIHRLRSVVEYTEKDGIAIYGLPGRFDVDMPAYRVFRFFPGYEEDFDYFWCQCPGCGVSGVQWYGRWTRNKHMVGCVGEPRNVWDGQGEETEQLVGAYESAMSERFGERS